ncbi:cytochrome P450 [Mycena capillaripes]|nr:cytochrome P450 [Mycena capillaripes]
MALRSRAVPVPILCLTALHASRWSNSMLLRCTHISQRHAGNNQRDPSGERLSAKEIGRSAPAFKWRSVNLRGVDLARARTGEDDGKKVNVKKECGHYLNAFIKKGLRLYGAAPSLLEPLVPVSTSKNFAGADGFDLMGYVLPPGTIVSTQAWSMHHDPAVFPSPETFLPERWLPSYAASKEDVVGSEEREAAWLARMASHMMPFGTGSRICGGLNLAHIIMRVVLVPVLRNFEVEAAPGTDEKSMNMRDSFVMFPAAMECKLIFHPRMPA